MEQSPSSEQKKHPIAVVLSGGGLRGIAHLGVLKSLEEHGIRPSCMAGTSAGAIISVLYAAGYSPDFLLETVKGHDFFTKADLRLNHNGIFSQKFLVRLFEQLLPENDFSALSIPVYVAATEIRQGQIEYFYEGAIYPALLASSCIPFLFAPYHMGEKIYLDGGILNNLPIEPVQHQSQYIIGVHVNAIDQSYQEKYSLRQMADRVFHLSISHPVYAKAIHCDLFIDPPNMTRFGVMSKKDAEEIFYFAYEYTSEQLKKYPKPFI